MLAYYETYVTFTVELELVALIPACFALIENTIALTWMGMRMSRDHKEMMREDHKAIMKDHKAILEDHKAIMEILDRITERLRGKRD